MEHLNEHLNERQLIEYLWDQAGLTTAERDHLAHCAHCQRRLGSLAHLHDELEVMRRSQLTPATENRYASILAQAGQATEPETPVHHLLSSLAGWVTALPLWDSRQPALVSGVRSGHLASYRLLFGTEETEVELMVEPLDGRLRVVGEVMRAGKDGESGVALVELMAADSQFEVEIESDEQGRFQLERVPPGTYVMTITPRFSKVVVINPLGLT